MLAPVLFWLGHLVQCQDRSVRQAGENDFVADLVSDCMIGHEDLH